jgi:trk system potassium uptake protein TrkH
MAIRILSSSGATGPERVMIRSLAITILAGTVLLALPASNQSGQWLDPLTAAFMATSATCVTGLTVCDPGSTFTHLGQGILLGLIQVGGLQIMTLGTLALILLGKRLSLRDELVTMEALGHTDAHDLPTLIRRTLLLTFTLEASGCLTLAWRFHTSHDMPFPTALYYGAFHAISAFCNAGFSLYPDSIASFRTDPIVLLTLGLLIVTGGLGFGVLYNAGKARSWSRLALHARLTICTTAALILTGWLAFLAFESNYTLSGLGTRDRAICAFFQSVTPRTAGFAVIDMATVQPETLWTTMMLMFIGGSSASTAGGIKTTTFLVLILVSVSFLRRRREVVAMHRTLPDHNIRTALAVFLLGLATLLTAFMLLLILEPQLPVHGTISSAEALLFEVISALGTVGLSTGITPHLGDFARVCLIACMFLGKVGPLVIAVVVGSREIRQTVRHPEEDIVVG